jgi:hypothetical protein
MAEFSKQYVENYMPEWGGWDFDIEEEFNKLQPGEFVSAICEGFGFCGLQKKLDGSREFLYRNNSGEIIEIPYELAEDNTYRYIRGYN